MPPKDRAICTLTSARPAAAPASVPNVPAACAPRATRMVASPARSPSAPAVCAAVSTRAAAEPAMPPRLLAVCAPVWMAAAAAPARAPNAAALTALTSAPPNTEPLTVRSRPLPESSRPSPSSGHQPHSPLVRAGADAAISAVISPVESAAVQMRTSRISQSTQFVPSLPRTSDPGVNARLLKNSAAVAELLTCSRLTLLLRR